MPLTRSGFWSDPEFTNTRLLTGLARTRPESALSVLTSPNITGEDLITVAKIAKWDRTSFASVRPHELMPDRTADDQYQLVLHAAKRSQAAVDRLLPYANTDCLARLHANLQAGARGTARIGNAWSQFGSEFDVLDLDPDHPQYMPLLRSIERYVPGWQLEEFTLALVAGAKTADDDARVARTIGTPMGVPWLSPNLAASLVLRTWDDPERLLRWCTGGEMGTLIARAHPKLPAEASCDLVPVTDKNWPKPPRWKPGRPMSHKEIYTATGLELNLFDLVYAMVKETTSWAYLQAALLLDSEKTTEAEKVLLAGELEHLTRGVPGRLSDLIERHAAMTIEDKLDQLDHLSANTVEKMRAMGYLDDQEADEVPFIRTDDDARAAAIRTVQRSEWVDDTNRWVAAPWLHANVTSVQALIDIATTDTDFVEEENLYDFVHELLDEHDVPAEARYTDVFGDALGQL